MTNEFALALRIMTPQQRIQLERLIRLQESRMEWCPDENQYEPPHPEWDDEALSMVQGEIMEDQRVEQEHMYTMHGVREDFATDLENFMHGDSDDLPF